MVYYVTYDYGGEVILLAENLAQEIRDQEAIAKSIVSNAKAEAAKSGWRRMRSSLSKAQNSSVTDNGANELPPQPGQSRDNCEEARPTRSHSTKKRRTKQTELQIGWLER